MSDKKPTYVQQNPRPKLQGRTLSNWSLLDLALLLLFIGFIVLVFWLIDFAASLMVSAILVLLFRSSKGYGRLYYDLYKDGMSKWRNGFHNGIWWRAEDTEGSWLARWLRKRRSPLPAQFVRIQAKVDGELQRFCILHQTDRPYDQLYITARGGGFAGADVNDQTRLVTEMSTLIDQIIAQSGLKAGISQLRITGPYNQMVLAKNLQDGISPIIARPELFELDTATKEWVDWARENARQIPTELTRYRAAELWSFIVITIKRHRSWRNLTNQEIAETPIIELGQALIEGLRENSNLKLQDVHSPSLPEAALIARSAWDVTRVSDYFRRRENGEVPTTDEEVDAILARYVAEAEAKAVGIRSKRKRKAVLAAGMHEGAREIDRLLAAWPQECIETNGREHYLRFDDNYIAILRVVKTPEEFRSDQIMSLHSLVKKHWTRFAFVSESVSGQTQSDMLLWQASVAENFNQAFYGRRVIKDPRRTAKSRTAVDQLTHMSVNTIAQMANGVIVIVEHSPARLRLAVKSVSAKYGRIGFKIEQVKGSSRLLDWFFTGALAANRV